MTCTLEDPYILVLNQKLSQVKDLLPMLEAVSNTNKSLLIIAEDVDSEALATLIVNKARGTIKVAAVKAPDFGDRRKLILEDIASVTGGIVFDKDKGMKLDKFSWEWFGEARTVTISKEKTTIIDGKGDEKSVKERLEELTTQIDKAQSNFETEKLQERLAKMAGGVSIIHVGGYTETEMNEKKDRVDDALAATRAAVEEGIVSGGGVAIVRASKKLEKLTGENDDEQTGINIIERALEEPLRQIVANAGMEGSVIVSKVKDGKNDFGFNAKTEEFENLMKSGIIDPAKVVRVALQHAASVAGMLLTTECVISDIPEETPPMPPMSGGGMPGMM